MSSRCFVVLLRSGTVLLARRGAGGADAGRWELPNGPIGAGETPDAAAARILREDFCVEAQPVAELARDGDKIGVLVTKFAGKMRAVRHVETAWVESRRILERELAASCRAIAEVVASHRRRSRYKGTHPRAFEEKYKELSGDPEAMAKAAARGSTPAGAHLSIMVREVLAALSPLSGATILDCTLGWGGHAAELARAAGPSGKVIGLDRDGEELKRTVERLSAAGVKLVARQSDYAGAPAVLHDLGLDGVDALLADLGVSSMQLDRPERGMSFKSDGPLDMRMDRSRGPTAAEWLARATQEQIADALKRYGDEPDAVKIAAALRAMVNASRAPRTTAELAAAVASAKGLPPDALRKKDAFSKHPAARAFQALRIAVNSERESLSRLLSLLPTLLRPGGRVALLTFHSGEEFLVEAALRTQSAAGLWRVPMSTGRKASAEEVRLNPRARSARLWTAVRA
jgi:16S rRNA (cytosine1402-N4)-methyltransferase